MNVLQLSTSDYGGGAERMARDLDTGLRQRGMPTRLLVGRCRKPPSPNMEALYDRRRVGSRVWSRVRQEAEAITGRQGAMSKAFARWWQREKQNWDTVICHNLHGVYFDLSLLQPMCAEKPVFAVLHDLWLLTGHCAYPMDCMGFQRGCGNCPDLQALPRVWFDRTDKEWTRKAQLLRAARPTLVCVSEWTARQVSASSLADLPRVVVRNGLPDVPPPTEARARIRKRLGWPSDQLIYLYVSTGGLQGGTQYKDPQTLIDAARALRHMGQDPGKLIVTVGGTRPLGAEFGSLIRQYDHVASDLQDFYAAADVFVFPTKAESLPLVLIEAARAGLPTLTVDVGGCAEVVRHGENGFVVNRQNPAEFAAAMCEMAYVDRDEMGRCARRHYLAHFTDAHMLDTYEALCRTARAPDPLPIAVRTATTRQW